VAVSLIVGGVTFQYPVVNNEVWGTQATNWAIAVTDELTKISVAGDIAPTTLVTIANNQAVAADVTNFILDPATIRGGVAEYYVYRTWNSGANEVVEVGTLYFARLDTAAAWTIVQVGNNVGASGVVFTIDNPSGQVQYTSDNKTPSTGYAGSMKFRFRALGKT